MQTFKKLNFLQSLLSFALFFTTSTAQHTPTNDCGNIQLQIPFPSQNSTNSFPLNLMIKCKSQKLYYRTSLGLFPISSIDYKSKTLTISTLLHSSMYPLHFSLLVSLLLLSPTHFFSSTAHTKGFIIDPQLYSLTHVWSFFRSPRTGN